MHTAEVCFDSIERVNPVFPTLGPACENLERIRLIVRATCRLDGIAHADIVIPVREVFGLVRDRGNGSSHMDNAWRGERSLIDGLPLDCLLRRLVGVDNLAAHHLQRLRQISKEPLNLFPRDLLQPSRAACLQVHIETVWLLSDRVNTCDDVLLPVP